MAAFAASAGVIEVGHKEGVCLVISSPLAVSSLSYSRHGIFILAQGHGAYDGGRTALNLKKPPRRNRVVLNGPGCLSSPFPTFYSSAMLTHYDVGTPPRAPACSKRTY